MTTKKEILRKCSTQISLFDVARRVMKQENLLLLLSEKGKESFKHAIVFGLPVRTVVVPNDYESEIYDIARFLTIQVQNEITLSSYDWYGRVNKSIVDAILEIRTEKIKFTEDMVDKVMKK
jgi:hypothetical protein